MPNRQSNRRADRDRLPRIEGTLPRQRQRPPFRDLDERIPLRHRATRQLAPLRLSLLTVSVMSSKPEPRTCVFCGGTPLTKEHIWPQWIGDALPITAELVPHEVHDLPPWDAPPFSLTVKRVCASCNNGWMSDLETTARPSLTPMMLGQQVALDGPTQKVIATWTLKTAMMFQFTEKARSIPDEHYEFLYRRRAPPGSTLTWIARYVNLKPDGTWHVERMAHYASHKLEIIGSESGKLTHGYGVTMSIGQLVLQVLGVYGDHGERVHRSARSPGHSEEIWPTHGIVTWPPRFALDEKELDLFGRAFLST